MLGTFTGKSKKLIAALAAAAVVLAFSPLAAMDAHAAELNIPGTKAFTTTSVSPTAEVAYTQTIGESVYLDKFTNGIWVQKKLLGSQTNGTVDVAKSDHGTYAPAGTYTYRLRNGGNINSPSSVSQNITVTVNRQQTAINVGATALVGTLQTPGYRSTRNEVYYTFDKEMSVTWTGAGEVSNVYLQRKDGASWVEVDRTSSYTSTSSPTYTVKFTNVKQTVSAPTSYRLYVPQTEYVTGGYSQVFTVSGKKAAPGLVVKYSKSSQKYKKGGVKLDISIANKGAYEGKAYVYDGKKKLATLSVKSGYIKSKNGYYVQGNKYALPKKLKKGTHKIKVKFVPNSYYAKFYTTKTTGAKKIKVK
ncbi:MAG: hypothetical protein LBG50_03230 [Clostridiales Family XIII bacterium]|jgi:hypothetical protein|nr:hypothetical protein [Clostridiales Family XIII bacterium]